MKFRKKAKARLSPPFLIVLVVVVHGCVNG